jgi:hypothetical protein
MNFVAHLKILVIFLQVARMLMAVEHGRRHKYRGKSLDVIEHDGIVLNYLS